jgi:hypothetical protein
MGRPAHADPAGVAPVRPSQHRERVRALFSRRVINSGCDDKSLAQRHRIERSHTLGKRNYMKQHFIDALMISLLCLVARADMPSPDNLDQFQDVSAITVVSERSERQKVAVVVSNSIEIKGIVDGIILKPKVPSPCKHTDSALFQTKQGVITVSFCDHCFDMAVGDQYTSYEMPPLLYEKLVKHLPPSSSGALVLGFSPTGLTLIIGFLLLVIVGFAVVGRLTTKRTPHP